MWTTPTILNFCFISVFDSVLVVRQQHFYSCIIVCRFIPSEIQWLLCRFIPSEIQWLLCRFIPSEIQWLLCNQFCSS